MFQNEKLYEESLRFLKSLKPGDQIGKDTYVPEDGLTVNDIMIASPAPNTTFAMIYYGEDGDDMAAIHVYENGYIHSRDGFVIRRAGKAKSKSGRMYAIKMGNGDVYGIPAEVIADHYAKSYSQDGSEDYQSNYDTMIYWFDTGDYEFEDWARGNMDWDDVKDAAVLLEHPEPEVDFQDGWVNGKCEYIKKVVI